MSGQIVSLWLGSHWFYSPSEKSWVINDVVPVSEDGSILDAKYFII